MTATIPFATRVRILATVAVASGLIGGAYVYLAVVWCLAGVWEVPIVLVGAVAFFTWREQRGERMGLDRTRTHLARIEAQLDRLCAMADLPLPRVELVSSEATLSELRKWPGRRPTLRLSRGLLERVDDEQLAVVLAHELGHLANHDAAVMLLLAEPAEMAWRLSLLPVRRGGWTLGFFWIATLFYAPMACVLQLAARAVSRDRELAADRYAAVLTGRPMALGAVLRELTGATLPSRDLRLAGGGMLNLLPVRPEPPAGGNGLVRFAGRAWSTHPTVARRVVALEELERGTTRLVLPD